MNRGTVESKGRGTTQLRSMNTRRLLAALRHLGTPTQISQLAERTSLTRPTVTQIVSTLEGRGWLQRYEPTATAGRPAVRYGLAQGSIAVFGADAGAHRVVLEVASLDGATRARRERRRTQPLGDVMLDVLSEMLRECLDEIGLGPAAVVAGTVGSPGIVERSSGRIALRPGLGDWDGAQVASSLGRHIGGVVTVENDANLATRAMCTAPEMPKTLLGLQWGQRLGAGIMLDGQVYRGRSGAAGELGSLLVPDPVTGDVRLLEEVVLASRLPLLGGVPQVSTEELIAAADAGDQRSAEALGRSVDPLAAAIAPICLGLELGTVTISGAIARSGPALVTALREKLHAHGALDVDCRLSPFLEDTVLRGAVDNAIDAGWTWLLEECAPQEQVLAVPLS